MGFSKIKYFMQLESVSGLILLAAALLALLIANSSLANSYFSFSHQLEPYVNEVLMVFFFLVIGLELKRNYVNGVFGRQADILLPGLTALAGMIVPAAVYCWVNRNQPELLNGWSIPVATDIAFALGVLALCGQRVPQTLKLFLLWLAIFDDIGAIIIIALFYSQSLAWGWLIVALLCFLLLILFNKIELRPLIWFLFPAIGLWCSIWYAGIHPTIAGILVALTIPIDRKGDAVAYLEQLLHPWTTFLIVPLFVFLNAGVTLSFTWDALFNSLTFGIILGLFIGKPLGILSMAWLLTKTGLTKLPQNATWLEFSATAILCGIGFTMSLFLGTLAFPNAINYLAQLRLGVIIGSLLSGLSGAILFALAFALKRRNH